MAGMPNWNAVAAHFGMTEDERRAYYYSLLYLKLAREMFPGWRHGNVRRGDPRKSELFRYAWRFLDETAGKLDPKDREAFVRAQLTIFKAHDNPEAPPLVSPNCLVGPKAWNRWLVWQRERAKDANAAKLTEARPVAPETVAALRATRDFFVSRGIDTAEKVRAALDSGEIGRWVRVGRVSGCYVILSPVVDRWLGGRAASDVFGAGVTAWHPRVDDHARDLFRRGFPHEFL